MKFEYIKPFVEATKSTFSVTLGLEAEAGKPFSFSGQADFLDVSAMIGLAGEVKGAVILSFTDENSMSISKKFAGIESSEVDETVIDAIGELVNIVAGNAKEGLLEYRIYISLPKVARKSISLVTPEDALFVTIPFEISLGHFNLTVALSDNK